MTPRATARICLSAAAMCIASLSKAGVWGTQPVLGVSADYASNPALLTIPDTAETHAALLLDAPASYVGDAYKLTILPSFRLSDSQGYSTLDSDYEHLTVSNEFDTARSTFTVAAMVGRDSSLYRDYLLNGSAGVRRDSGTVDLNWDRHMTERLDFDADLNSQRVRFAESAGSSLNSSLTDYKYTSLSPTLSWDESERGKLTASISVGRYDSLSAETESENANLQLGFVQKLSAIWTLSASAGYSRADNQAEETVCSEYVITPSGIFCLVPVGVDYKSTQNGTIFQASLTRQTSLWTLTATASQQLAPTGFAFLSRQDLYELRAIYAVSPRWTITGDARENSYQQPTASGVGSAELRTTSLQASAAWLWTEHWTLTMNASYVTEHYGSPSTSLSDTSVSVEVSRQFDWKKFR